MHEKSRQTPATGFYPRLRTRLRGGPTDLDLTARQPDGLRTALRSDMMRPSVTKSQGLCTSCSSQLSVVLTLIARACQRSPAPGVLGYTPLKTMVTPGSTRHRAVASSCRTSLKPPERPLLLKFFLVHLASQRSDGSQSSILKLVDPWAATPGWSPCT